jgi:hypothetical protein
MFAVNMSSTITSFVCGSLFALGLGCGGAQSHTGYPAGEKEPWASPAKLKLNENFEAWTDSSVSYPSRERARWYAIDLPHPGSLHAKVRMDRQSTGADVGFEILDAGYNVIAGPIDDNDIGREEKERKVKEARAGRVYFHVYTLGDTDAADFRLSIRFDPILSDQPVAIADGEPTADPRGSFPWTVPNLAAIPGVPAKDDAPRRGRAPRPEPEEEDEPAPVAEADPADNAKVRASIIEFGKKGSRVRILVNKGSAAGVAEGWRGYVVGKNGKSVPKGAFKISKTKSDESEGFVGLTLDQVQANRTVVLKPPQ